MQHKLSGKYEGRSYHQLRRMFRNLPDEDKVEASLVITNFYRKIVERSVAHQFPDASEGERKAAFIERMYRKDYSVEEMECIKQACINFHAK